MDVHVLALAMSDLRDPLDSGTDTIREGKYYCGTEDNIAFQCSGIGQLEVIPQYITGHLDTGITHIIILETPETKKELNYDWKRINALCGNTLFPDDMPEEGLSAVRFFKHRMHAMKINGDGPDPEYIDLDLDIDHPEAGLEKLLQTIRTLYNECEQENGDWKLWLDTHGAFREVSLAMFALMQVLSSSPVEGIPQLTDGLGIIPVDQVFTVNYNPDKRMNQIRDLTDFYRMFTGPAFKAYMNYGQYFLSHLEAYEGEDPYAFISYRTADAMKERYLVLGMLKKAGLLYWYDDGIHIHDNWQTTLFERNRDSAVFIALLSEGYFHSYECVKELRQALDEGKPVIFISLDRTLPYISGELRCGKAGREIIITAEETAKLVQSNHIVLKKYDVDGVFQEERFLAELMRENGFLKQIRSTENRSDAVSFVNFSNHPSARWSDEQAAAARQFGEIVDIPFPAVDPHASSRDLDVLSDRIMTQIMRAKPKAVLCQGEFTLAFAVTKKLQKQNIPVYAACSERNVIEKTDPDGNTVRESVFRFVRFREYL